MYAWHFAASFYLPCPWHYFQWWVWAYFCSEWVWGENIHWVARVLAMRPWQVLGDVVRLTRRYMQRRWAGCCCQAVRHWLCLELRLNFRWCHATPPQYHHHPKHPLLLYHLQSSLIDYCRQKPTTNISIWENNLLRAQTFFWIRNYFTIHYLWDTYPSSLLMLFVSSSDTFDMPNNGRLVLLTKFSLLLRSSSPITFDPHIIGHFSSL